MKAIHLAKTSLWIGLTFGILSYNNHLLAQSNSKQQVENTVSVTIDKNTTDEDFESIKEMLLEYNIEASFDNVKRNRDNEITSIGIKLKSTYSQTNSSISSNTPIQPITFGSKNGNLFVGRDDSKMNMLALFNGNKGFSFSSETDSIFGKHFNSFNLDDFFNGHSNLFMFNGDSIDIEALKDKFFGRFNSKINQQQKNPSRDYFYGKKESDDYQYNFVDDPNKDTLIVIDGNISEFSKLDHLAKTNKLKSVDVLQPDTAMSIYGAKAKDGAIIATTK